MVFVGSGVHNRGGGRRGGRIVGVTALRRILPRRGLGGVATEFSSPVVRLDVVQNGQPIAVPVCAHEKNVNKSRREKRKRKKNTKRKR